MSGKFLEVNTLEVQYVLREETVYAVNNVSFSLKKGETLGLVGETGAGKTSIARAILRVLPVPPSQVKNGEVLLEGRNLFEISEEEMCKVRGNKITMIFQDPMTALNPVMTVGSQIEEVITLHNDISRAEARQRAEKMLELVGIPAERYDEYPHQFSGGMKQRVVIAVALACDPDLLLADEPTTALDVTIQAQILDLIRNLREEKNTSMILITHDLGVVAEMCDSVAVVYAGEIIEYGTLEDIFDHPRHPYTVGLFRSLPDAAAEGSTRLQPIPGMTPDPTALPEGCKFYPRCPYATDKCKKEAPLPVTISGEHYCKCHVMPEM